MGTRQAKPARPEYDGPSAFDNLTVEKVKDVFMVLAEQEETQSGINETAFRRHLTSLGFSETFLQDRLFEVFDENGDGKVDFAEFICGLSFLSHGSPGDKLAFIFNSMDTNNDAHLNKQEVYNMFFRVTNASQAIVNALDQARSEDKKKKKNKKDAEPEPPAPAAAIVTPAELMEMVDRCVADADLDNDQRLSKSEFINWGCKSPEVVSWLEDLANLQLK